MDIDILLALQQFRNGIGGCLAEFMTKMTFFGELSTTPVLLAIVYWCISKEYGSYLMVGWAGNRLINGSLKVTACAYRPWIRDARIIPYGNSIHTATGYSFPSGHSMNGATVFGGGLVRRDFPLSLRIVFGIIVFLIAFSRIYLGVHTPQDILVGMTAGLAMMWVTFKLMQWVDVHPDKDWIVTCVGIVLAAIIALYAAFKSYPVDYDASGKVLVDGAKMANDTFKCVGWCSGILLGWLLERRFVKFSTDITMIRRIMRLVTGLLSYYAVNLILCSKLKAMIGGPVGSIVSCFVQMFYIAFIYPLCLKYFEKS
ncbi:MAG: phosphatase PAP2 family protein [Spirochaetia bacterium]|nr:phosphatase PAP2 family protein [Spirochaetia bacterium]